MEEGRSASIILTGKSIGKIPLGRLKGRWDDNIIMYFKEIVINMKNLVDWAQDRDYCRVLVNAALNLRVPYPMELDNFKVTQVRHLDPEVT